MAREVAGRVHDYDALAILNLVESSCVDAVQIFIDG